MPDMLVKLYELPDITELNNKMCEYGIDVRRAIAPEKHVITDWVNAHFGPGWESECEVAFTNHPVSCYIAVANGNLIGFACYDSTCRNFFGPLGVSEGARGKGAGKALLLKCLYAMKEEGYAYAIIGGAGPAEFYTKNAGATVIEGSVPGIYRDMLESKK